MARAVRSDAAVAQPTIVFLVVTSSIAYLRIFDYVYAMTNGQGGPLDATKPLVLKIFETAFTHFEMGYAATQTVILFAILLAISLCSSSVAQPMSPSGARRKVVTWTLLFLGGIVMVIPFAYMLARRSSSTTRSTSFRCCRASRRSTTTAASSSARASCAGSAIRSCRHRRTASGAVLRQPRRLHARQVPLSRALRRVHRDPEHADDPDRDAGAAVVLDGEDVRLARHLLGDRFPGLMTGFGVFLMKQFFEGVPDELLDAARIDGLNEFQVWWQVAMPLVTPALSALAIFTFLGNWTAFLWPLICITDRNLYTLPVGLASFSGEFQTEWEMVMTGASVATIRRSLCSCCCSATSSAGIALRAQG
jgi:multiple sugar transport system permease protein